MNIFLFFVRFFLLLFQIQKDIMSFLGFKFQIFSGRVYPQDSALHARDIGHTRGLRSLLSPSNILSYRKVAFKKMPPPHGKILKKGPGPVGCHWPGFFWHASCMPKKARSMNEVPKIQIWLVIVRYIHAQKKCRVLLVKTLSQHRWWFSLRDLIRDQNSEDFAFTTLYF